MVLDKVVLYLQYPTLNMEHEDFSLFFSIGALSNTSIARGRHLHFTFDDQSRPLHHGVWNFELQDNFEFLETLQNLQRLWEPTQQLEAALSRILHATPSPPSLSTPTPTSTSVSVAAATRAATHDASACSCANEGSRTCSPVQHVVVFDAEPTTTEDEGGLTDNEDTCATARTRVLEHSSDGDTSAEEGALPSKAASFCASRMQSLTPSSSKVGNNIGEKAERVFLSPKTCGGVLLRCAVSENNLAATSDALPNRRAAVAGAFVRAPSQSGLILPASLPLASTSSSSTSSRAVALHDKPVCLGSALARSPPQRSASSPSRSACSHSKRCANKLGLAGRQPAAATAVVMATTTDSLHFCSHANSADMRSQSPTTTATTNSATSSTGVRRKKVRRRRGYTVTPQSSLDRQGELHPRHRHRFLHRDDSVCSYSSFGGSSGSSSSSSFGAYSSRSSYGSSTGSSVDFGCSHSSRHVHIYEELPSNTSTPEERVPTEPSAVAISGARPLDQSGAAQSATQPDDPPAHAQPAHAQPAHAQPAHAQPAQPPSRTSLPHSAENRDGVGGSSSNDNDGGGGDFDPSASLTSLHNAYERTGRVRLSLDDLIALERHRSWREHGPKHGSVPAAFRVTAASRDTSADIGLGVDVEVDVEVNTKVEMDACAPAKKQGDGTAPRTAHHVQSPPSSSEQAALRASTAGLRTGAPVTPRVQTSATAEATQPPPTPPPRPTGLAPLLEATGPLYDNARNSSSKGTSSSSSSSSDVRGQTDGVERVGGYVSLAELNQAQVYKSSCV